ncbi:MAG: hypothetical protein ACRDGH_17955 [Candidatus Limnocylindria bacterium]
MDRSGVTTIDPPGSPYDPDAANVFLADVNNRGQIVGQYVDAASTLHGYLWHPGRGFKTIDLPRGAQLVGPAGDRGTIAADINDRGEIALPLPGGFFKGRTANLEP